VYKALVTKCPENVGKLMIKPLFMRNYSSGTVAQVINRTIAINNIN
jgi:hypothetical protein